MQSTDSELLTKARRGDEDAYQEIVDCFAGGLYRLAFALLGNAADAEDALQETLAGAFRGIERFEGRASLKTWLSRILVKQAARRRRSRKRSEALPLHGLSGGAADPADGSASGREGTLALRMDVLVALDALDPHHREVVALREFQGMSYDEIAGALGVPRGTVESRLFRARQILRERLKDYLP